MVEEPLHLTYDEALPITAWHDEIAGLVRDHPVVVVAGETGSGKTTQLPKICLELGRRSIAHTQPRRLAARTVAQRVADEMETTLGDVVGYQVRFTRQTSRATLLKIMTDGVLLAEIGRDRDLRRYDTIIVDEAHERSLNIDFLLGYLKQLLTRRDDLRVIITSATIDTARFAEHFAGPDGTPAPVVEVSGRTYPVEMRYRPILDEGAGTADQNAAVVEAVKELSALGGGDVLVFLSGEREIRDAADALNGAGLRSTEVLPLFARLSTAEQHRVFAPHPGRRVVLATNVAETSLTVPGIRYVVDVGTARISRYSARTKVQRLPIEPVSQASANQRAGRCGRVAPGVCIRLYSEEDFAARPLFTEPEILRTNLASVILQMAAAELGDIASFPFVEAPDRSQVSDGLRLLAELGAIRGDERDGSRPQRVEGAVRLTKVGQRLAAIPVDPRMGRMLLAAERQGCLREMLVVVAGLSIPDPRERPAEQRERADALHRRFWAAMPSDRTSGAEGQKDAAPAGSTAAQEPEPPVNDGSDFLALLRLWDYLRASRKELSGNAFRRRVREEFLHYLRIREWQDLHTQLKQVCKDLGMSSNEEPAGADRVHAAALAGLLSHVGLLDEREEARTGRGAKPAPRSRRRVSREYLGARGTRFVINPGSAAAARPPQLVVAAEIVETSRLFARTVAGITPAQVEEVGQHLLHRTYSEPHWSSRAGSVMAYEQVTLYGVPVVSRRRVGYARVNPAEAREIFLRAALVEGRWHTRHRFLKHNAEVRAEVEELEERTRRRDLAVDDETIFAFYDARVPADATSGAAFDAWWKTARHETPELLDLSLADLTTGPSGLATAEAYPDHWDVAGHRLPVAYRFSPGDPRDGVSVTVPVDVLNQVGPAPFGWQVPGLRLELATELVRSLPRAVRRLLVPAPENAERALAWVRDHPGPFGEGFTAALGRAVRVLTGETVPADAWDLEAVPAHLRVTFVVVDAAGEVLAEGKDLAALKTELSAQVNAALAATADTFTRTGITRWDFGRLEPELTVTRDGRSVVGYPSLVDEQTSVTLRLLDTPARQAHATAAGLRRLVLLGTPDPTRWVVGHLSNLDKLALGSSPYAGVPALLADARLASVGELVRRHQQVPVQDADAFTRLCDAVRQDNPDLMRSVVALAAEVLRAWGPLQSGLPQVAARSQEAADDLREQLANLVFTGFLSATPYEHLVDLPRYLQAAQQRVTTLQTQPTRDRPALETVLRCEDAYAALVAEVPPGPLPPVVAEVGWLLEELRVSLFAQGLRTKVPVSEKRVRSAVEAARARLG
ncbi:ATP-dependent helicase HrpA [Microlunatus flavus]|uniref:ATP-dependent helicase HrpA n=1 Tax=Microlunatus flavus TaxID=1036181 RepID=A0A1H9J9G5_9ACTN|nr:ATP-dependent helicase HrpA [Microlunatus flavus]